ncbi:MAG TPA: alpha/beta hydrolase [Burkholderiaceae bacterium]|jgi:pimeloyl-ACP methyl ester carboxylesterase|nr:alpha/beta hydrolase [Burkholderiaceae bacterium]
MTEIRTHSSPIDGIQLRSLEANGIRQRFAECGSGPLVVFCHGFPESWYSWRHQLQALSRAGYRCVAPDMRGYGGTDAPDEIERYTILDLVGDMVALVRALGETRAVVVGHDWGAPVAWHCALLRADLFRAAAGLSVPYAPRGDLDFLSALRRLGITTFYSQYFQEPGVAEAEFQRDVRTALRRIYYTAGGEMTDESRGFAVLPPGQGFLANTVDPQVLPPWFGERDLDWYAAEFSRTGFRGGLNWYRNYVRNWRLTAPWHGEPIRQPSLFIAGTRDAVLRFPGARKRIDAFAQTLPGLRGAHLFEGAGHWIQQERPAQVNEALANFLRSLD